MGNVMFIRIGLRQKTRMGAFVYSLKPAPKEERVFYGSSMKGTGSPLCGSSPFF